MPALPVLWLYCAVKGTRLVVDWHNYSHTILQVIKSSYNDGHAVQCTGQRRLSYHLNYPPEKYCNNTMDEKYFDFQYYECAITDTVVASSTLVGALLVILVVEVIS